MKKLAILTLLVVTALAVEIENVSAQAIVTDQVPAAVKQAFQTRFPTVKLAEWKIKPDKNYEAEFTLKGTDIAVKFDSTGKWLETESAIPPSKVPKAVGNTIARQFKGYKTVETQTLQRWNEQQPIYELHLENAVETVKAQFSADGTILNQSAKPNAAKTEIAPQTLPKFTHPLAITNTFLPLASLKQDILERTEGKNVVMRVERTVKPERHKVFKIGNQTVGALVVEDREFEDGKLAEVALDYFAQADDGTVYYLGEDVDEYKNGKITGHSGAWLLGKDTQNPGVLMPAHPKAGDKFKAEDVPKITTEDDEIISLSETVTVPAGTFKDCLKIKEVLSDGGTEYKYYAPGVGCVKEVEPEGELPLKSHETRKAAN